MYIYIYIHIVVHVYCISYIMLLYSIDYVVVHHILCVCVSYIIVSVISCISYIISIVYNVLIFVIVYHIFCYCISCVMSIVYQRLSYCVSYTILIYIMCNVFYTTSCILHIKYDILHIIHQTLLILITWILCTIHTYILCLLQLYSDTFIPYHPGLYLRPSCRVRVFSRSVLRQTAWHSTSITGGLKSQPVISIYRENLRDFWLVVSNPLKNISQLG